MNESINNEPVAAKGLHQLQPSDFQPFLGQEFSIQFSEDVRAVALLETVLELPGYSNLERKPFSIILKTHQQRTYYQQAIYTIEHHTLGSLAIFLVPVGVNEKGMQYEAVFS